MKKLRVLVRIIPFFLLACQSSHEENIKETLSEILKKNPEILTEAIKKNPVQFLKAFQEAAQEGSKSLALERQKKEQEEFEAAYENPLRPNIRSDETIRGTKGAPLVLVKYSDFQCGYCGRAYNTVQDLLKKYKGKIQFIYKHFPIQAPEPSKYYEAIRLQSEKKAFKFHDILYENQSKVRGGKDYFDFVAKKVGADMKKLLKALNSNKVLGRIDEDQNEATKFGFGGTPGFIFNGVPIKGAMPMAKFEEVIQTLQDKGIVTL